MKKYLGFTLLMISIIITGCDKKQYLNYPASSEIVGLATVTELDYNETTCCSG
jgi:hypothetical protein